MYTIELASSKCNHFLVDENGHAVALVFDSADLARLFAAAPEMFEALESVIVASAGWHDSEDCRIEGRTDCEMCAALRDARAALAAAKPQGGE